MADVEAVLPRDAEQAVRDYLLPYLGGVPVSSRVPNPRPSTWLRIVRTGGVMETLVSDRAQIAVEAWADNEDDAIDLLNLARAWLLRADGRVFGAVEASGPGNLPDPTTAQIRYTMSIWVRIRGTVITG